mmetsp:Transcript_5447/g.9202  ORF Transcript_5447/g.9202 Transcript_5447/m.9202 type:complete len:152 (+) Transcript_5447:3-458(+)
MTDVCQHWNQDNVQEVLTGKMIYKDECAKCFATPTSETGLDVCLKCFLGSCRPASGDPAENHSLVHKNNSGHQIVLNIKKVLKEEANKPVEITKVAIGVPGGIDPLVDKYDTKVSVHCHGCDKDLDHSNAMVKPLVDSILLSQSASEQSQI